MTTQAQILAVETGLKTKTNEEFTLVYREIQKPALVTGQQRVFEKRFDDGIDYPREYQGVQLSAEAAVDMVQEILARRYDVTLIKDDANTKAKADVVLDGVTLLADVPATYLLFLEKQMVEMKDFISSLPTLDPQQVWTADPSLGAGIWRSEKITTVKTQKQQKALVLYEATDKHPAQVQLITEDTVEGFWNTERFSGALPIDRKQQLLDRVAKLSEAIKFARERANTQVVVDSLSAGAPLLGYLFA